MLKKRWSVVLLLCALCLLGGTGCRNVKREKELLIQAQGLIEERKYPQAIGVLSEIADNDTAAELLDQLYYVISGDYIENLGVGAAAIDREGHVCLMAHSCYFSYFDEDQEGSLKTVGEWENIRRLSGAHGLDALDKDGGFYTLRGTSLLADYTVRNCRLMGLEPLQLLSSYYQDLAAVQMDGTFCAYEEFTDYLESDSVKQKMAQWTDIKDIVSGECVIVVLFGDGTVDFVCENSGYERLYRDMWEWTDIVAIDGMTGCCIAGLKSDGTVVVSNHGVGENERANFSDALEWTDIIAVSKNFDNLLGLKRDGTVVAAGRFRSGQEKVKEWTDIVAISAGQNIHIGLKSDGTLVMAGDFGGELELPDVTEMKDLYVPEITLDSSKLQ